MKNTLTIVIIILTCISGYAQPGKGRMMISGSLNYSQNQKNQYDTSQSKSVSGNKSYAISGSMRYGYFITDKILVGVLGGYGYQNNTETQNGTIPVIYSSKYLSQSYSAGVFSRYYKMIAKSKFAVFGQLSASCGMSRSGNKYTLSNIGAGGTTTDGPRGTTSFISAGINPGITYFLTNKLAFEMSFGSISYYSQRSKNYDANNTLLTDSRNSGFNSNLSFSFSSLTLGASFYFGGKPSLSEPEK
jgi:outer membrane protein W